MITGAILLAIGFIVGNANMLLIMWLANETAKETVKKYMKNNVKDGQEDDDGNKD